MSTHALILCYHGVKDEVDSGLRPTTVADFRRQMRFLSQAYTPISLPQLVQHLQDAAPFPPRAVAVTLDDGYRDNYENAYPLLQEYRIPATIFLATRFLGTGEIPPWEKGRYTGPKPLMLSWPQVRRMSAGGISFGAHTLTHPFLTRIPRRQAQAEIHQSKDVIEQQIGKPVTLLAYPSGDFNADIAEMVQGTGYAAAVSIVPGSVRVHDDPYALKRNLIQLQSVCHRLFPLSYVAEMTGVVEQVRVGYYRMRRLWAPVGEGGPSARREKQGRGSSIFEV